MHRKTNTYHAHTYIDKHIHTYRLAGRCREIGKGKGVVKRSMVHTMYILISIDVHIQRDAHTLDLL